MKVIKCSDAPEAIGPYSQGVMAGGTLFVSGQLPIKEGVLIDEAGKGAEAALANVLSIVKEAGGDKESIVKVGVFVRDLADFAEINQAYESFFGSHKPARALVQVARLPKDAVIEIEAVAVMAEEI